MRTKWVHRFDTVIAEKAVKDGVWRRKDGGFVIRARIRDPRTGKDREIRRVLPHATLEEALAQLTEEKQKIIEGDTPVAIPKIRFRDYARALFEKKFQTGQIRSASSRLRWTTVLKVHLNPRLGDLYMSELRRSDLLSLHEHLSRLMTTGRYAPHSCATILKLAKVIVRAFALEHSQPDIAAGIPGFDLSFRRTYTREQPNSLRPPETEAFLAVVGQKYPQYLSLVTLGFALGLRPSSLRALHKVDILWEEGWLLNRRSHTYRQEIMERTKIGKDTEIPLSPELLDLLRRHVAGLPAGPMRDSPLLFPNADGQVLARHRIWRVFSSVQATLGLTKKITPRGMRRTSKDLLRMSGASQVVAMAINGHHTDAMHYHYSTVNESEVRDVLSRTVKLMGMDPAKGPSGGEIGGKAPDEDPGKTGQRRESGEETAKGNFSVWETAPEEKKRRSSGRG